MSAVPFCVSFGNKNSHFFEKDPSSLFNEKSNALSSMDLIDIEEDNFSKCSTDIQKEFLDESSSELDDADIILISERSSISISEHIQNQINNLNTINIVF